MAQDKYFFDKRTMKRIFKKYGIILLICVPFLLTFNLLVGKYLNDFATIGIDILIGLIIIAVSEIVCARMKKNKEEKLEATKKKTTQLITIKHENDVNQTKPEVSKNNHKKKK